MFRKKTIGYVSEIDKISIEFDKNYPLSASQRAEIKKYEQIDRLRDYPRLPSDQPSLWEEF